MEQLNNEGIQVRKAYVSLLFKIGHCEKGVVTTGILK